MLYDKATAWILCSGSSMSTQDHTAHLVAVHTPRGSSWGCSLSGLWAPWCTEYLFHFSSLDNICSSLKIQLRHHFVRGLLCSTPFLQAERGSYHQSPAALCKPSITVLTSRHCYDLWSLYVTLPGPGPIHLHTPSIWHSAQHSVLLSGCLLDEILYIQLYLQKGEINEHLINTTP